jgi:hypothetical protein
MGIHKKISLVSGDVSINSDPYLYDNFINLEIHHSNLSNEILV